GRARGGAGARVRGRPARPRRRAWPAPPRRRARLRPAGTSGAGLVLSDVANAVFAQGRAGLRGEPAVTREQDGVVERFGEREIGRVIRAEAATQRPDALAPRRV